MTKQEYDKMLGINNFEPKHTTPKERKVKLAVALKGKDEKYWNKCTSKQLSGINNQLFDLPITHN
jgi:hypothetical protein